MASYLESLPLKEDDYLHWQSFEQTYQQIQRRSPSADGEVSTAVNEGVGEGFITVKTHGKKEFIMFNVLVMKIRRETFALEKGTDEDRRNWCKMAKAFIDYFGVEKTPPDIIKCLGEVREVFAVQDVDY